MLGVYGMYMYIPAYVIAVGVCGVCVSKEKFNGQLCKLHVHVHAHVLHTHYQPCLHVTQVPNHITHAVCIIISYSPGLAIIKHVTSHNSTVLTQECPLPL